MFTWQTAVAMFIGAIVLAVIFIIARGKDSQTGWEFPADDENDGNDEKRLDWGRRSDFWLAEFDRAHAEQDLLGEELARESMEFLLDTAPDERVPPPSSPPPVARRPHKPGTLRMKDGREIAVAWTKDGADLSGGFLRAGEQMTEEESRYLQKEAYRGYTIGDITDEQWALVRHARRDGLSFNEVRTLVCCWVQNPAARKP